MEPAVNLEQEIIEGYREMADIYLEIQREVEPLDAEVTRAYRSMQQVDQALIAVGLR